MARKRLSDEQVRRATCVEGRDQSFLWDTEAPGLGLRVTANGAKSYIFQSKLAGASIRITIGDVKTWPLMALRDKAGRPIGKGAREEANRLQQIVNEGRDPRIVKADGLAAERDEREQVAAARAADEARERRESMTLGQAWSEYVADRSALWSDLHTRDHERAIQAGGAARKRSLLLTKPGPLASLASRRLADLDYDEVEAWAKLEAGVRPTSARLALRLLKAFLNWCASHKEYKLIVGANAATSKRARESLGKPRTKNDVMQRQQLQAWFSAVQRLDNPVIRAYLQTLLLTGARREELAVLRWDDLNFRWNHIKLNDKVEEFRMVPLTPYVSSLLADLYRRNKRPPNLRTIKRMESRGEVWTPSPWVFQSRRAASGRITDPSSAHTTACAMAGIELTLHGLRRSFATLSEWVETPAGISSQIQGHAPQGVREQNYIRRPLDLLRMWHIKIEKWILDEAGIAFVADSPGLRLVSAAEG